MLDEETFTRYYEEYFPLMFHYISRRIADRAEVEDLVSNVFLKAIEQRDSFDEEKGTFKTWIYKIATNTMIDFFRKKSKSSHTALGDELIETLPSQEKTASRLTDEHLQKAHIHKVMNTLSERYQEALLLRYFTDCSIEEMTKILNISPNNTSVLLSRAHAAFMQSYTRLTPHDITSRDI